MQSLKVLIMPGLLHVFKCLRQGWSNCGSLNDCMQVFELSENLYIYFLFLLQSVEIL